MSDWRDVMEARSAADNAIPSREAVETRIEDRGETTVIAILLAARAVCLELRALGVTLDYLRSTVR